jgi:hypothetical protein
MPSYFCALPQVVDGAGRRKRLRRPSLFAVTWFWASQMQRRTVVVVFRQRGEYES